MEKSFDFVVLGDPNNTGVLGILPGSSEQEHLDNLAQVLQRLEAAGMRLMP